MFGGGGTWETFTETKSFALNIWLNGGEDSSHIQLLTAQLPKIRIPHPTNYGRGGFWALGGSSFEISRMAS